MKKTIKVKLKGYFYIFDTYCYTLKEYMEKRGIKRSQIDAWWKWKRLRRITRLCWTKYMAAHVKLPLQSKENNIRANMARYYAGITLWHFWLDIDFGLNTIKIWIKIIIAVDTASTIAHRLVYCVAAIEKLYWKMYVRL